MSLEQNPFDPADWIEKGLKDGSLAAQTCCGRGPKVNVKAATHDDGKAPLAQLPWEAINQMAMVQLYGQKKYGDFYNYKKGMEVSRNLSCAIRHIRDYMQGVNKDHESGENPLAHAMVRLAFVLENIHDGKAIDDRYLTSKKPE